MTTICWTIVHHSVGPIAHVVRRALGPVVHHIARRLHHVLRVAAHPHTWIEVVCKTLPAVIIGGGLIASHPANPPPLLEPPQAVLEPAPTFSPWFPPGWLTPPAMPVEPYAGPAPVPEVAPEPGSAGLLLGGATALLLIRLMTRRLPHSSQRPLSVGAGDEPGRRPPTLCHPVLRPRLYIGWTCAGRAPSTAGGALPTRLRPVKTGARPQRPASR